MNNPVALMTVVVSRPRSNAGSVTLNREENICETGGGLLAVPVALQFADELHPAHRFAACLDETPHAKFVRFGRGSADAIYDRIHLKALLDGIKRRMHKAHLGPERSHDELLSARGF